MAKKIQSKPTAASKSASKKSPKVTPKKTAPKATAKKADLKGKAAKATPKKAVAKTAKPPIAPKASKSSNAMKAVQLAKNGAAKLINQVKSQVKTQMKSIAQPKLTATTKTSSPTSVEISSRKDLKKAAQVADAMTAKKRGGRGPKAPPSVYTQSLSTLNRSSGVSAPISLSQHSENVCREVACDQLATASGYCRVHYIKNWSQIKRKEVILKERKLDTFIEEIVTKYPEKYVEAIKTDLVNERSFAKVVADLELDGGPTEDMDSATDMDAESDAEPVIDTARSGFDSDSEGF